MNLKLIATTLAFGTLAALIPACAADSQSNEPETEEAATSEDALHKYSGGLVGAYHGDFASVPPSFEGIVFREDGSFFADVNTGILCVMAPCPTTARLEGRYYATRNYLKLYGKSADGFGDDSYGWYRYIKQDDKLSLWRPWSKTKWQQSLAKELSYCAQPTDCNTQMLIAPACVGQWSCEKNSCAWDCGIPTQTVWPSDATKVVANSPGGGFTPPPPPGSSCAFGAQKFSLDIQSGKLDWETCEFVDWSSPMTLQKGSRTLSTAEIDTIKLAGMKLELAKEKICGADKPWMDVTITSKSQGEQTYADSFYSCNGGGQKYVDNIDAIFGAMRDQAHN